MYIQREKWRRYANTMNRFLLDTERSKQMVRDSITSVRERGGASLKMERLLAMCLVAEQAFSNRAWQVLLQTVDGRLCIEIEKGILLNNGDVKGVTSLPDY